MIRLLSLLLTPWAILVSSSLSLYLLNQENLDYNPAMLLPFLAAALIGVLIGYGIQQDSEKNQHYLAAPWLFYFAGPVFILWNTVDAYLSTPVSHWIWLLGAKALWLVSSLALKEVAPRRAAAFFAVFAALIILTDGVSFLTGALSGPSPGVKSEQSNLRSPPPSSEEGNGADLANIYHVILDAYQSDVLTATLDDDLHQGLRGFRFYPNNISVFGNTWVSIPSVFSGKTWKGEISSTEFAAQAFAAPNSLPALLERAGYSTTAYLHQEYPFEPNRFGQVFYHHEFATSRPWSDRAFLWVWMYAYWPKPLAQYMLGPSVIGRIQSGELSPQGFPVVSLDVFERFLAQEPALPGNGRYTFLHLLLPHPPYRLSADCEPRESADELNQYRCANQIVVQLLMELKRLGRFEESLIIIHADHGDDLDLQGLQVRQLRHDKADLDYLKTNSRALLLYKPPGGSGREVLRIEDDLTTLLDVAPTILGALGIEVPGSMEGHSLDKTATRSATRYFHVHDGLALYRYTIRDGSWDGVPENLGKTPAEESQSK